MNAIYGTAENGERLPVVFGTYSGMAGVRQRDGGREVAYYGDPPRMIGFGGKVVGTIDGTEATATTMLPSVIAGFTVLWVPDIP